MEKKNLGQYYTTNRDVILTGMKVPEEETVIEPFVGNGDLVSNIPEERLECYDINPECKYSSFIQRDVFLDPPSYNGKYVITNPPYLARNKASDKTVFDKYNQNDLYKCFLSQLISSSCLGAILVLPLNFWCSVRTGDVELRKKFVEKFRITRLNIFEERVFDDTSSAISCVQIEPTTRNRRFPLFMFSKDDIERRKIFLSEENRFTVGGEMFYLPRSNYKITRYGIGDDIPKNNDITNIVIRCIDTTELIKAEMVSDENRYKDSSRNKSARSFFTPVISPSISLQKQERLVNEFNKFLNTKREETFSLFLPAYRERTRKRLPFELAFSILSHLLL